MTVRQLIIYMLNELPLDSEVTIAIDNGGEYSYFNPYAFATYDDGMVGIIGREYDNEEAIKC